MFELIHESGYAGWTTLIFTIAGAAAVLTVGRRRGRPGSVAACWAVVVLGSGALGFGTGQRKVDQGVRRFDPEKRVMALSIGTREASTNMILAGAGAQLLCLLGGVLVLASRDKSAPPPPPPANA